MKVAISGTGPSLDHAVDERFGRCPFFLLVDIETLDFEVVANLHADAAGGAGIQAAQLVVDHNAQAVLTGRCGPKAMQVFEATGIPVIQGVSGTIREAVACHRQSGEPASPLQHERERP